MVFQVLYRYTPPMPVALLQVTELPTHATANVRNYIAALRHELQRVHTSVSE